MIRPTIRDEFAAATFTRWIDAGGNDAGAKRIAGLVRAFDDFMFHPNSPEGKDWQELKIKDELNLDEALLAGFCYGLLSSGLKRDADP